MRQSEELVVHQPSDNAFFKFAKIASSWFAVFVALVYGSGFLCVYTFLDRFGIRGTGGDFFRVRYVHVGILFLLFPICVLTPLAVALSLKRIQLKAKAADNAGNRATGWRGRKLVNQEKQVKIPLSSYLLFLNMGWVFYLYILFTPREFLFTREKEIILPLIFIASLLGPRLIEWGVGRYVVRHRLENCSRGLRWLFFLIIVIPLDYLAFRGFFGELWVIFWGNRGIVPAGAVYYLLLMAMIPYTFWRANVRCKQIEHQRARKEWRLAATCLCLMFYFIAINSFALRVFPHIPLSKGGGDYSHIPTVTLKLRETAVPSSIVANTDPVGLGLTVSNCFLIIEETPTSLFLANTNNVGGPTKWREMRDLPRVVEVRRDSVDRITY
jgi:hypothetical protein